ncbi:MAG: hypothetical protein JO188_04555 [Hyphomicrobiales bacterium]|nr:hypothetical protein [Hyphomicrobiales bacterium]
MPNSITRGGWGAEIVGPREAGGSALATACSLPDKPESWPVVAEAVGCGKFGVMATSAAGACTGEGAVNAGAGAGDAATGAGAAAGAGVDGGADTIGGAAKLIAGAEPASGGGDRTGAAC